MVSSTLRKSKILALVERTYVQPYFSSFEPGVPGDHVADVSRGFQRADTVVSPVSGRGCIFRQACSRCIFGVYALSLLAALLTVGSLSDHLGRKPVIFAALVLNMLAMLLFINEGSVAWLIAARTVQGFATGMATAVLGAALLDTDRQQGPLVNSVAPLLGMACGAMGSSLLVEFAPLPTQLIYWTLLALMLVQALYLMAPAGNR